MTSNTNTNEQGLAPWKRNAYLAGGILGLVAGALSAHLFVRTAQENSSDPDSPPESVTTLQMIAIGVAVLTLIRQIAELGRPRKR
jgi:hypothetical protein